MSYYERTNANESVLNGCAGCERTDAGRWHFHLRLKCILECPVLSPVDGDVPCACHPAMLTETVLLATRTAARLHVQAETWTTIVQGTPA